MRLRLRGIERFALRDAGFGERIENKNIWRAPFGLRKNVQLGDELRIESRRAPACDIQRDAFGALRREWKFQLVAERFPIAFIGILPAAKPF